MPEIPLTAGRVQWLASWREIAEAEPLISTLRRRIAALAGECESWPR